MLLFQCQTPHLILVGICCHTSIEGFQLRISKSLDQSFREIICIGSSGFCLSQSLLSSNLAVTLIPFLRSIFVLIMFDMRLTGPLSDLFPLNLPLTGALTTLPTVDDTSLH